MKRIPRAIKDGYPQTGTGIRHGERLMRQKANFMLDFKASERCIARIRARLQTP